MTTLNKDPVEMKSFLFHSGTLVIVKRPLRFDDLYPLLVDEYRNLTFGKVPQCAIRNCMGKSAMCKAEWVISRMEQVKLSLRWISNRGKPRNPKYRLK